MILTGIAAVVVVEISHGRKGEPEGRWEEKKERRKRESIRCRKGIIC
jgi:hypothetical protein